MTVKGTFIEADIAEIDTAIKAYDEHNQEVEVVYTAETESEEENNG